jgi:hypothetical protein
MTEIGKGKKYAWLQTDKGRAYIKRHNHDAAERTARWRAKDPEAARAKHAAYQRVWRATPKGKRMKRNSALVSAYGITLEQMEEMIAAQDGVCPICLQILNPMGKGRACAAVDHDHDTGKVRGILCQSCNAALGSLGDSPDALKRAFKYLTHK